jgi:4,5-DOPA dioxygenase extradiol
MTPTADPMPVLYLSHGAPPLADDTRWTAELAAWSAELPRPRNILMVSAHWESAPIAVSSTSGTTPLVYDFWGFPQKYYEVTYAAPGAPDLATSVAGLLAGAGEHLHQDPDRGLDHGAYVPLVEMFPEADIPVLQLSMPTLDPQRLFALGRRLAPLRDEGTLIVGSGFTTHNLRWFNPRAGADGTPPTPSSEFDHWAAETMAAWGRRQPARLPRQGPRCARGPPAHRALGSALCRARGRRRLRRHRGAQCHRRLLVRPVQAQLAARLSPPSRCTPQLGCGSSAASGTVEP